MHFRRRKYFRLTLRILHAASATWRRTVATLRTASYVLLLMRRRHAANATDAVADFDRIVGMIVRLLIISSTDGGTELDAILIRISRGWKTIR